MLLLFASGLAVAAQDNTIAAAKSPELSQGISVRLVPQQAHPGDIVEFVVEMEREDWGRFDLQIPGHPALRRIASESVPLTYRDGHYQQRQRLLLQPMTSGSVVITAAKVLLATSNGTQSVSLPEITLDVQAFEDNELSASPLPLPLPKSNDTTTAHDSTINWFALANVVAAALLLAAAYYLMKRNPSQLRNATDDKASHTSQIVQKLDSGIVPKDDLEQLLVDPDVDLPDSLRRAIENAVYSETPQPSDLAKLLNKELRFKDPQYKEVRS